MEPLRDLSEDEVILAFLRAELNTPRQFERREALGTPATLMTHANLDDPEENDARRSLLAAYRGFPDALLFEGFPHNVHWQLVRMSADELLGIRFLKFGGWITMSGGTRRVQVVAERIRSGIVSSTDDEDFTPRPGLSEALEGIIAATDGRMLTLIEGHHRVTGLALAPERCPEHLEIIVGTSARMNDWVFF